MITTAYKMAHAMGVYSAMSTIEPTPSSLCMLPANTCRFDFSWL